MRAHHALGIPGLLVLVACGNGTSAAKSTAKTTHGTDGGGAVDAAPSSWSIGVSTVDVSPNDTELATQKLYMGAYGVGPVRGPAQGIHDPVMARAIVFHAGKNVVAMEIIDMPGISNRVIHAIVDEVVANGSIPKEAVFVGATHSHSAPDLQGLWGGVPDDYKKRIEHLAAQAILDADSSAVPADLFVSRGEAANRNRRGWPITDKELTILSAKTKAGDPIATVVQFAAHPVILGQQNLMISRDFCGYTVDFVEKKLGGKAFYWNGVVGDASPDGTVGSAFAGAQNYGETLARAALDAMDAANGGAPVTPAIYRDYQPYEQQVTNQAFVAANAVGLLDYDVTTLDGGLGISTQAAYFRLGTEVQAVAFPGEALTRTGLDIKAPMTAPYHLWLGLTTDTLGYFVKADEWMTGRNGNYEESVSMGLGAAERAIQLLTDAVGRDKTP